MQVAELFAELCVGGHLTLVLLLLVDEFDAQFAHLRAMLVDSYLCIERTWNVDDRTALRHFILSVCLSETEVNREREAPFSITDLSNR